MAIRKGVFVVNGVERILFGDPEKDSLADVLRRTGLTSVKLGCGTGQCGVCTIILDGKPCRACIKKYGKVAEHSVIETLEGFGTANNLHPLQQAWITYGGVQCGFCTPGFIVSAKALLDVNPNPTRQDVRDWFTKNNNLCRCTGYKQLVDAVMAAAAVMRGEKTMEDITFKIPNRESIRFYYLYRTNTITPEAMAAHTQDIYRKVMDSNTLALMSDDTKTMMSLLLKAGITGDKRWISEALPTIDETEWRKLLVYADHENVRTVVDLGARVLGVHHPYIETSQIKSYLPTSYKLKCDASR